MRLVCDKLYNLKIIVEFHSYRCIMMGLNLTVSYKIIHHIIIFTLLLIFVVLHSSSQRNLHIHPYLSLPPLYFAVIYISNFIVFLNFIPGPILLHACYKAVEKNR